MFHTFDNYKKIYPEWLSIQEIINEYISMVEEYTNFPIVGKAKIAYTFDSNSLNNKLMRLGDTSDIFIHFSVFLEEFLSNKKKINNAEQLKAFIIEGERIFFKPNY